MISLDLETELIAPGYTAPRPVLAQSANFPAGPDAFARGNAIMCRPGSETFRALVTEFLANGGAGQNLPFDLGVLIEHGHATIEKVFDALDRGVLHSVDTRQRLLDIAAGDYFKRKYNLGALAERYGITGIDKSSPWRLRYAELEHVPWSDWPEDAIAYALGDVTSPVTIFEYQELERARLRASLGSDPLADEARALRAQWALALVATHGVVPDREAIEYYRAWVDGRQKASRRLLLRAGLLKLGGNGRYRKEQKKLRVMVVDRWTRRAGRFDSLGAWLRHRGESAESFQTRSGLDSWALEQVMDKTPMTGLEAFKATLVAEATSWEYVPYPRTKSGKYPSLDEPTAQALDLPELYAWLDYSSAHSDENRWSELALTLCPTHRKEKKKPGREIGKCGEYGCYWRSSVVHTRFDLAETGRSKSSGPNIQNRKKVGPDRECFKPEAGLIYLVTDHDQLELSTVAQGLIAFGCGDNLARAINAGMDGHLMLAAEILQIGYEDAKARRARKDPEIQKWRQVAKAANFGFAGGLGVPGFMGYALTIYGVRISLEDAKRVKAAWFRRWPEFRSYFKRMGSETRRGTGTIRQLYTERLRGGAKFTDACNTIFQGLGGDLTSSVLYELQRDTRRKPTIDPRDVTACFLANRQGVDHRLDVFSGAERAEFLKNWRASVIPELANDLNCHPREVTNALLEGARVENYVHDEYLLAVHYNPVREGALLVDPLLEARALAKEYVVRTVSEAWLPDMSPTATAEACVRWSKASRDVRDEFGRPIAWEVCPEVDALAREDYSDPWASGVNDLADGCDRAKLNARLASRVPGYRRVPSDEVVREAIADSSA